MEGTDLSWRTSSYSSNGGNDCVEAASHDGTVMVRDTKQHGRGRVYTFTASEWRAFLAGVKARPQADR
jgi:hypothetical protein